jgi:hypothetical protein
MITKTCKSCKGVNFSISKETYSDSTKIKCSHCGEEEFILNYEEIIKILI